MSALFLSIAALTAPLHFLLVTLPGGHHFGHVLLGVIGAWFLALTVVTQPQKAPEGAVSPDGYPLTVDLATLNADLWLMEGLRVQTGAQFYTLGSTPIWTRTCAVKYCEHTAEMTCFCVEDCDCPTHTALRDEADLGWMVTV